jgi:hypothetical protein
MWLKQLLQMLQHLLLWGFVAVSLWWVLKVKASDEAEIGPATAGSGGSADPIVGTETTSG